MTTTGDEEALAMAYAAAVNEEVRELQGGRRRRGPARRAVAAGARGPRGALRREGDQPRPRRASKAPRSCTCASATPLLVKDKPSGYSFLPQLADTTASQISIEAAQPRLDLAVLKELGARRP